MTELNMSEMSLIKYLKEQHNDISTLTADEILREAFEYENTLEATSMYDVLDIDEEKIFGHIQAKNADEKKHISRRKKHR